MFDLKCRKPYQFSDFRRINEWTRKSSQLRHIPTGIGWYNYAQSKNQGPTASQGTESLSLALREYSNITAQFRISQVYLGNILYT
jgi:hypothetical protein